ncbi:ATP-binding cassette domain-containing protein [Streptomyces formicae]|uniref:ATP-binding cassette domain-containing protein n=1 Tax=Streptomyces formicae TaxID=1616117 RepID=A0ABY3WTG0_9ACTN|nr:ATP-binding cassette domain-containing protein [Streptomyces formicae]UNM14587.1 ATP-binding cassette domain-containing protein [Streptomyces formicae]
MDMHGAAVTAAGFGLKGPRGWAFRGVDVDAGPGSLIAIEGPSGSGRTCLLLALTGRMKPAEGHAEAGGLRLPRKMAAVRRISALGPVPGVSELDPSFTVAEHLHERALLQRRFDGSLRALLRPRGERAASARTRVEEALETAGLDLDSLPKAGRTAVRDLERLEALRLSVALGLIGRPRLLAVDDTDLKLSATDRAEAWELLRRVTAKGTTVLAVCSEAPEDAVVIRTGSSGAAGRNASGTPGAAAPHNAAGEPPGTPAEPKPEPESGPERPEADAETEPQAEPDAYAQPGTEPGTEADPAPEPKPKPGAHAGSKTEEEAADALAETGRA